MIKRLMLIYLHQMIYQKKIAHTSRLMKLMKLMVEKIEKLGKYFQIKLKSIKFIQMSMTKL